MAWPIYIATEAPELLPQLDVKILRLPMEAEGFLDSRAEATRLLPPDIKYVFPIQEDFLLEGRPMTQEIAGAFEALADEHVLSVRLMPCPGPKGPVFYNEFKVLDFAIEMVFTYQATLWKRDAYQTFMNTLLHRLKGKSQAEKNRIAIKVNIAENADGQAILRDLFPDAMHLSVIRQYPHPNAVYLCPWPYRPTAVVQGVLQPWALELANREGFQLNH